MLLKLEKLKIFAIKQFTNNEENLQNNENLDESIFDFRPTIFINSFPPDKQLEGLIKIKKILKN